MLHPNVLLGNPRGGFVFAHALPPLGTLYATREFPLALSPKAVLVHREGEFATNPSERPLRKCFRWTDIRTVEAAGKKIILNGDLFWKAPTPAVAARMLAPLREIRQAKPSERQALIEQILRKSFDLVEIEQRWQQFAGLTAKLRLLANILFGYLFILAPTLIWLLGFRKTWLPLLVGLFLLTALISFRFQNAHKILFQTEEEERFTHSIILLLSPATAIRVLDVLSRPLLEAFHPLAASKVLCSERQFGVLSGNWLRAARHVPTRETSGAHSLETETEQFWNMARQRSLENFIEQIGLSPKQLLRPPTPADETCLAYCPRCLAQFTIPTGTCPDCGGLALQPFLQPNSAQ